MNYKNKSMPKAPPRKPTFLDPTHPMNTEGRNSRPPRMKRGASKQQNFGQIITGNYSSDK